MVISQYTERSKRPNTTFRKRSRQKIVTLVGQNPPRRINVKKLLKEDNPFGFVSDLLREEDEISEVEDPSLKLLSTSITDCDIYLIHVIILKIFHGVPFLNL